MLLETTMHVGNLGTQVVQKNHEHICMWPNR